MKIDDDNATNGIGGGGNLVIRGPRRAESVAKKLIAHKTEVLVALVAGRPSAATHETEAADVRNLYDERAAIREHEAGYSRATAATLAYAETIEEWCRRHPPPHDPGTCAGCGKPLIGIALDLPDGARVHWGQDRSFASSFACLINYGFARKRKAVAAIAALGLIPPPGWEP